MRKFNERKIVIIFLPINLNICFNETVLLSTHNICCGREIKKIVLQYGLLSGGLFRPQKNLRVILGVCGKYQNLMSWPK